MSRFLLRSGCLLLLAVSYLLSQTSTSQINGTVHDATGAVIPGATVRITNEATGITQTQQTTDAGLFAFPALPVGIYTVEVDQKGFKTAKRTGNQLVVNTPLDVEMALSIGETTDVVSVEASAEQLQTSNATIGNVVSEKAIKDLPLNGRNPLSLLTLEPGVVQRSAGGVGSGIHVNGSRDRAYNVTIDGIEANESSVPNPLSNLYRITPDNTQEYKVTTSNATAEEGRNSGATMSVATKSGTNQFHGTLFEFNRNSVFNSNDFYSNAQGLAKAPIKLNQYGAQLSGPIIKNKTFFFVSWADQRISYAQPIDQTAGLPLIYTPSARAGIFRYWVNGTTPFKIGSTTITRNQPLLVDPKTGGLNTAAGVRPCQGAGDSNCVATYNFGADDPKGIGPDASIAKLFNSYPLPNNYSSAGDGLNYATYAWNPPTKVQGPSYMGRLDHNFSNNDTIYGRWLQSDYNTLQGDPLNGRPQVFPGFPPLGEVYRTTKNFAVSYRHLFSPRVVNEFTAGYARFYFLFTQGEANPTFPDVLPYTFSIATLPYSNTPRTARAVNTPQLIDNLSIIKGSHIIRTGFNIRMYQHNDQRGQPGGINVTPALSFLSSVRQPQGFNLPTNINSADLTNLQGTINDVLGIPSRLSQTFLGDLRSDAYLPFRTGNSVTLWAEGQRLKQYNFYGQDEWKLKRNLVLNYGLRWELNPAPSEAGGRVYVPNKAVDGSQGPVTFVHADRWFKNNNLGAFAPSLGVAWSPGSNGRTVIRTGYRMAFDPLSSFQVTAVAGRVPGLTTSCASVPGPGGSTTAGCTAVPDIRIAQGFPVELPPPTTKPSASLTLQPSLLSVSPALTVFDQNLKLPTVHQWNLQVQHEFRGGFVAQVGYIGKRGTRLYRAYDLNQVNSDPIVNQFVLMQQNNARGCNPDGTAKGTCIGGTPIPLVTSGVLTSAFVNSTTTITDLNTNGAGNFAGRVEQTTLNARLRPNQQFGVITYLDSGGDSYYHSLQAVMRKRFGAGLLVNAAYTLGKSIDDQSVDPVGSSSGGGLSTTTSRAPADIRDWRNERARSDFDRRHVFTANWIYDLPFGHGKQFGGGMPGFVNQVLGGWSLNGIYTFMTGEPFSVRSGIRTQNYSHESRASVVGALPEVNYQQKGGAFGPVVFDDSTVVNITDYSSPGFKIPLAGQNGAGRNIFQAASYWNLDTSISKRFPIREHMGFQFRAEMFNVLNHPNFDNPVSASSGSPSIRSALFAQACCATVAPPSTQTIIQTGESARVIQFALKFDF